MGNNLGWGTTWDGEQTQTRESLPLLVVGDVGLPHDFFPVTQTLDAHRKLSIEPSNEEREHAVDVGEHEVIVVAHHGEGMELNAVFLSRKCEAVHKKKVDWTSPGSAVCCGL